MSVLFSPGMIKGGETPPPWNSCGPACDIVHCITFNYQEFEVCQLHQDQLAMTCPMNMFHNHGIQVLLSELCSYWFWHLLTILTSTQTNSKEEKIHSFHWYYTLKWPLIMYFEYNWIFFSEVNLYSFCDYKFWKFEWCCVVLSCGSERKKVHGIWPSPSLDTIFSESEFIKIKIF